MRHLRVTRSLCAAACPILLGAAGVAHAAGHLDVDDAGTLAPGRCQYEIWAGRFSAPAIGDAHLGPACRVGPFELGLNVDRALATGDRAWVAGPQLKWTYAGQAVDAVWSGAVSASLSSDRSHHGRPGGQLVLPVSWHPWRPLLVHANLGADWTPGTGACTGRGGLGVEWTPVSALTLLAERNRAFDLWTSRAGVRVNFSRTLSVDVTASRTGAARVRGFAVGLNQEFGRP